MKPELSFIGRRRLTVVQAVMFLMVVLLTAQMWLLTATLESYLAGQLDAALPGALISGVLFAACLTLYRFVCRLDRSRNNEEDTQ